MDLKKFTLIQTLMDFLIQLLELILLKTKPVQAQTEDDGF